MKVPLFPFHTWLPDAHTDAPTAGSVVLAGVLLKMGTYGFLRFAIPMFPQAAVDLAPVLLVLAVIGITYGAIVAAMQPNLKRIIAYSSIAHLGFVVLGVFALTNQGISGGLFTMLSHGLTTGALFLLVGMLYDRRHTYELIASSAGSGRRCRCFGGLFVAATFASIGLPGFSGFVGEFLVAARRVPHEPLVRRGRDHRRDPRRGLPAVGRAARVHRRARRARTSRRRDIGFRELCTVVPLLGLSPVPRLLPEAGARPAAAERRRARHPRRHAQRPQAAAGRLDRDLRRDARALRCQSASRVAAANRDCVAASAPATPTSDRRPRHAIARRRSTGSRSRPRSRCSRAALADRAPALAACGTTRASTRRR